MIDKADLPVLIAGCLGLLGIIMIVLSLAALFGFALHVFTWAYSGVW